MVAVALADLEDDSQRRGVSGEDTSTLVAAVTDAVVGQGNNVFGSPLLIFTPVFSHANDICGMHSEFPSSLKPSEASKRHGAGSNPQIFP